MTVHHFYGQIVLARVDDGRGNDKPHPVVVVTPDDQIVPGEPLRVVAISTQVEQPIPPHHVELPWQRPHHPKTGLNKPNVAKCDWLTTIEETRVIRAMGHVPPDRMVAIGAALKALAEGAIE